MRLIDATRIEQFILNNCSDNEEINTIYGELINAPTIDIVRCGECIWKDECILGSYGVSEQGFCYKGERKTQKLTQIEFEKLLITQMKGE